MDEILRNPAPLFERMEDRLKGFQRKHYADVFRDYIEENETFFTKLGQMSDSEDAQEQSEEFANLVVSYMLKSMDGITGKGKRERKQLDYNMFMAVYLLPAILEGKQGKARELTDLICEKWEAAFKGSHIRGADFSSIASGFKTNMCYITTAVCRSLNKPDDCYELGLLRGYRDDYLMRTEEGRLLVGKYYDVAPTIVKRIDKTQDASERYFHIWESYLKPCVAAIERGAMEECGSIYVDMVEALCRQYVYTAKMKDIERK